mgnify:CR=1 FL=1
MTWYYLLVAIAVASLIVAYIVVSMFSDRKEPKIGKEEFYEKYKDINVFDPKIEKNVIELLKQMKIDKRPMIAEQIAGRLMRQERIPPQGGSGTAPPKEIIDLTPSDEQHDGFAPIASSVIGEWEKERDAMVHDAEEKMRSQIELLKAENRKTLRLYYQAMNQVAHLRNKITIAEGKVKDEMSLLVTYSRMPGTEDESANASGSAQRPITVPQAHESGRE